MVHSSNLTAYYITIRGVKSNSSEGGKAEKSEAKQHQDEDWKAKYEEQVKINKQLQDQVKQLENRIKELSAAKSTPAPAPAKKEQAEEKKEEEIDLFGDDGDDTWETEIQKRADEHIAKRKAENEAKGKGPVVQKSAVTLDVKPWEAETDLAKLEELVRSVVIEGLEWKAFPIGYGVKKLQILAHVEDEKVSVDDIQEKIQEFEDYVQSTDVVSFVKL